MVMVMTLGRAGCRVGAAAARCWHCTSSCCGLHPATRCCVRPATSGPTGKKSQARSVAILPRGGRVTPPRGHGPHVRAIAWPRIFPCVRKGPLLSSISTSTAILPVSEYSAPVHPLWGSSDNTAVRPLRDGAVDQVNVSDLHGSRPTVNANHAGLNRKRSVDLFVGVGFCPARFLSV